MEIVEYEMRKFYCLDCERKSLINVRVALICPVCGSTNVELVRPRRPHRVTEDHQWDSYMNSFRNPPRPNILPGDYFNTGILHFGGMFSRRHRSLFDVFFNHFPNFQSPEIHSYFDEPFPFFTQMDIGDVLSYMAQQHSSEHTPASQESINRLKDVIIGEFEANELCSVCQEGFKQAETVKMLPCKHHFHTDCILPWFRVKDSCPLCRSPIG